MVGKKDPSQLLSQTQEVYDQIADDFNKTRDYLWNDMKPLLKYTEKGDTVLDVGCGNGRLIQLFRNMDVQYIGIDRSERMISIARERFPEGRYLVADMTRILLQKDSVDTIYAMASFHHLPTEHLRIQALKEMKRMLKDDGHIVMLNWNLYSNWARGKGLEGDEQGDFMVPWRNPQQEVVGIRYYHGFLLEELHELASVAGLEIILQYYTKDGQVSSLGPGDNILTVMKPV